MVFREQGQPAGVTAVRAMHWLSQPDVYSKWDSPNAESILAWAKLCRWNLWVWPRSPVRVGFVKLDYIGESKKTLTKLEYRY